MTRVLITAAVGAVLSGVIGYFLLPLLRALKAGQSIREDGPIWHNYKAGTPMIVYKVAINSHKFAVVASLEVFPGEVVVFGFRSICC